MTNCKHYPFTLPSIDFVGGSDQELSFNVYFHSNREPFDLTGCEARFSVVSFLNREGQIVVGPKNMTVHRGGSADGHTYYNVLRVTLTSEETVQLSGKYIYQISIKNGDVAEIPNQGVLYITNNIDKGFITDT